MTVVRSTIGRLKNTLRGRVQRWGSLRLKGMLWNREYASGKWDCCENTSGDSVYSYIERYCNSGGLLDLGCGSGNTGNELPPNKYDYYTGVDVSRVAIERAALRSRQNGRGHLNQYFESDIASYVPSREYDVILFRESIYYIARSKLPSTLERYRRYLRRNGVFIVTVYARDAFGWIVRFIEENHTVVERYWPATSSEVFLVFR